MADDVPVMSVAEAAAEAGKAMEDAMDHCVGSVALDVLHHSQRCKRLWQVLQGFELGLLSPPDDADAGPTPVDAAATAGDARAGAGGQGSGPPPFASESTRKWVRGLPLPLQVSYRKRRAKLRMVSLVCRRRAESGGFPMPHPSTTPPPASAFSPLRTSDVPGPSPLPAGGGPGSTPATPVRRRRASAAPPRRYSVLDPVRAMVCAAAAEVAADGAGTGVGAGPPPQSGRPTVIVPAPLPPSQLAAPPSTTPVSTASAPRGGDTPSSPPAPGGSDVLSDAQLCLDAQREGLALPYLESMAESAWVSDTSNLSAADQAAMLMGGVSELGELLELLSGSMPEVALQSPTADGHRAFFGDDAASEPAAASSSSPAAQTLRSKLTDCHQALLNELEAQREVIAAARRDLQESRSEVIDVPVRVYTESPGTEPVTAEAAPTSATPAASSRADSAPQPWPWEDDAELLPPTVPVSPRTAKSPAASALPSSLSAATQYTPSPLVDTLGADNVLYQWRTRHTRNQLLRCRGAYRALVCLQHGISWRLAAAREVAKQQLRAACTALQATADVAPQFVWVGMEHAWSQGCSRALVTIVKAVKGVRAAVVIPARDGDGANAGAGSEDRTSPAVAASKAVTAVLHRLTELEAELSEVEAELPAARAKDARMATARIELIRARASLKACGEAASLDGDSPALAELRSHAQAVVDDMAVEHFDGFDDCLERRRDLLGEALALSRAAETVLSKGLEAAIAELTTQSEEVPSRASALRAIQNRQAERDKVMKAVHTAAARLAVFSGAPTTMLQAAAHALSTKRRSSKLQAQARRQSLQAGADLESALADAKLRRNEAEAAEQCSTVLHPSDRRAMGRSTYSSSGRFSMTHRPSGSVVSARPLTTSSRSHEDATSMTTGTVAATAVGVGGSATIGSDVLPPVRDLKEQYMLTKAECGDVGAGIAAARGAKHAVLVYNGVVSFWKNAAPRIVVLPAPLAAAAPFDAGDPLLPRFRADVVAQRSSEARTRLATAMDSAALYRNAKAGRKRLAAAAARLWVAKQLRMGLAPPRLRELLRFKAGSTGLECRLLSGWHHRQRLVQSQATMEGVALATKSLAWDVPSDAVMLAARVRRRQWRVTADVVAAAAPAAVTRLLQLNAFVLRAGVDFLRGLCTRTPRAKAATASSGTRPAIARSGAPAALMLGPSPRWHWPDTDDWQAVANADRRVKAMLRKAFSAYSPDTADARVVRLRKQASRLEAGMLAASLRGSSTEVDLDTVANPPTGDAGSTGRAGDAHDTTPKRNLLVAIGCAMALQRLHGVVAAQHRSVFESHATDEDSSRDG